MPPEPPAVDPDGGTQVTIALAAEWLPALIISARRLLKTSEWSGAAADRLLAAQRASMLIQLLAFPITTEADDMPTGAVIPFAGSTAPDGWLLCYGQAVSRSTYSALFALIGTTYGAGNGTTTFNVPDMRGRVPVALDNLGGSAASRVAAANALNVSGGEAAHTLTAAEIPAHNHTYQARSTADTGTGIPIIASNTGTSNRTFTTDNNTGGGGSHNNLQPYIALSFIIKT